MNEGPGLYHFPAMRRGDTFRTRDIAKLTQDGQPLELSRAKMQVRPRGGGPAILEWDTDAAAPTATITGVDQNTVTLSKVSAASMQLIPPGTHQYDLEVWFSAGDVKLTILAGSFPISADVTRDD